jgi:tetratricopeptide (TPR) repeat protein
MSCSAVEDLLFDYAVGDLPEAELAAIRVHLAICPECMELSRLCSNLPAAVSTAEMPPTIPVPGRGAFGMTAATGGRRIRAGLLVASIAAAAAVALALGYLSSYGAGAGAGAVPGEAVAALGAPRADAACEERGESVIGPFSGSPAAVPGAAIWLGEGAAMDVPGARAGEVMIGLRGGELVVEIEPGTEDFRLIVETPGGYLIARGTVFAVEVASDGSQTVRVTEGLLEVGGFSPAGIVEVGPGQELSSGDSDPRAASVTRMADDLFRAAGDSRFAPEGLEGAALAENGDAPSDSAAARLVKLARSYRSARSYDAAARVYQNLIDAYPSDETAVNSLVALAQMELVFMGRPARAAAHFDRYLALRPAGSLAGVAAAGRAEATSPSR